MTAPKYEVHLDLAGVNDSRSLALARVPHRSRVLDVGIGSGTMGRILRQFDCHISGIEQNKEFVEASIDVYDSLVHVDVEQIDFTAEFPGARFDVILMLDVLEHLRDPAAVLSRSCDVLDDLGFLIISLPNVTHAAVKLQLLSGKFSYTPEGLLDETHIRFFDVDKIQALLADAGLGMFDLVRVTREPDQTEIALDLSAVRPEVLEAATEAPESRTYQFVICAAPLRSPVLATPPQSQAAVLQGEVIRLQSELAAARERFNQEEQRLTELLAQSPVNQRPWIDHTTIEWIDEMLAEVRLREMHHQNAVKEIVAHFESTVREIWELIESIPQ